jgi:RNA polymerase sigma factor (sigma-70 family)
LSLAAATFGQPLHKIEPFDRSLPLNVQMDENALPALARRAQGGDGEALDELLRCLRPTLVRVTRLVVGAGSPAAEDAAQEALFDVTRGLGQLRAPERVRPWAIQVAVRRARRVARRERLREYLPFRREVGGPGPELESERARVIKSAFDQLPVALRTVAVLRLYVGLSERETAQVLDCPTGTVKSQLHEARRRLSDELRRRGFAPQTSAAMCAVPVPEGRNA